MKPTLLSITMKTKLNMSSTTITTVMLLIMPTVSGGFTAPIFMTLFTGTHGITIHIIMILSIILHGTIHLGRMAPTGDGAVIGIHPITAGDGDILPITAPGTVLIMAITDGIIHTIHGTEAAIGMLILIITDMDREDQQVRMYAMALMTAEEYQHQLSVHLQHPPEM